MKGSAQKTNQKPLRKIEQEKQQMKRLVWVTIAVAAIVMILIVAVVIQNPVAEKVDPIEFSYETLPVLGDPNAPVKIVEFGDYKCPACKRFNEEIKPKLISDYIEKGIVSFYFMNANLPNVGSDTYTASLAAQSVFHANNEAFWKFHDAIYENQGNEETEWATPDFLTDLARKEELPIDYDLLMEEIETKKYQSEVDEHNATALMAEVRGTPTLFINGVKFENVFDYDALQKAIKKAQKGAGK